MNWVQLATVAVLLLNIVVAARTLYYVHKTKKLLKESERYRKLIDEIAKRSNG